MSGYIHLTSENSRPSTFATQGEWHFFMINTLTDLSFKSDSCIFYGYDTVFKGFAARLTTQETEQIKKMSGVSAVTEDAMKTVLRTTRSITTVSRP
ncbi:hypothetical protein LguiA_013893 [Lonicera macranthoides]